MNAGMPSSPRWARRWAGDPAGCSCHGRAATASSSTNGQRTTATHWPAARQSSPSICTSIRIRWTLAPKRPATSTRSWMLSAGPTPIGSSTKWRDTCGDDDKPSRRREQPHDPLNYQTLDRRALRPGRHPAGGVHSSFLVPVCRRRRIVQRGHTRLRKRPYSNRLMVEFPFGLRHGGARAAVWRPPRLLLRPDRVLGQGAPGNPCCGCAANLPTRGRGHDLSPDARPQLPLPCQPRVYVYGPGDREILHFYALRSLLYGPAFSRNREKRHKPDGAHAWCNPVPSILDGLPPPRVERHRRRCIVVLVARNGGARRQPAFCRCDCLENRDHPDLDF